jgi:multiple sugar transport system permease protein
LRHFLRRHGAGYAFAGPYLAGLVLLLAGPLVLSLAMSFCDWDGMGGLDRIHSVGVRHYAELWREFTTGVNSNGEPSFARLAVVNTLIYAAASVPLGLLAALGLALLLNRRLPGMGLFRTIFYLPAVVSGVATVLMWQWMFHPELGLVNSFLRGLGVNTAGHPVLRWLYSPEGCKPALIIMSLWTVGGAMLIFLAALQNVSDSLYEAARVDGAGRWRQFWHVTLPQISPAVFFNLVIGLIQAMQVFMQPFLVYSPQQDNRLLMAVPQIYYEAFQLGHFGYASALAWLLLGLILLLTLGLLWSSRKWVYYES